MKKDVVGCSKQDLFFDRLILISMDIVIPGKQGNFESK